MSDWIDIKQQLPDPNQRIIYIKASTKDGGIGEYNRRLNCVSDCRYKTGLDWSSITHWMPLPQTPVENYGDHWKKMRDLEQVIDSERGV